MATCEHCGKQHQSTNRFCPKTGKLIASRIFAKGEMLEGKYRINRTLGVGGMGAVFEATHTLLDKKVAIKVLLPGRVDEEGKMTARFVREARAASATGHINIATVTDMGWTDEGSLFVVMEYLDGETFVDLVDVGETLITPYACSLILQALSGLEAVHRKGIIHRDLKPENLMLVVDDEGEEVVKILDFGISKIVTNEEKLNLTATGMVMGTPQYMSPEQARSSPDIDHRTDIYSAGAILYLLLTGRPPIQEETISAQIVATVEGRIDAPSTHNPDLPRKLDRIVMKALARKREDRFRDAQSFYKALKPLLEDNSAADTVLSPSPMASNYAAAAELLKGLDGSSLVALDEIERKKKESDEYGEFDLEKVSATATTGPQPVSLKEVAAARRERAKQRKRSRIETGQTGKVDETGQTMQADSGEIEGAPDADVRADGQGAAAALENLSASSMTPIDERATGEEQLPPSTADEPEEEPAEVTPLDDAKEAAAPTTDEEEDEEEGEAGATARLRPDRKALEERRFGPPTDEGGWDGPLETEDIPEDDGLPRDSAVLTEASPPAPGTDEAAPDTTGPHQVSQTTGPHKAPRTTGPPPETQTTGRHKSPYGHARRKPGGANKWIGLGALLLVAIGGSYFYKILSKAAPENVRLSIYVIPQWAELLMNGQAVKVNPLVLPRSRDSVTLEASALGYRNKTVIVIPNKDQTIRIPLQPDPGVQQPPPGAAPGPAPGANP